MIRMQADVISKFKLHDRQTQSSQQDFFGMKVLTKKQDTTQYQTLGESR